MNKIFSDNAWEDYCFWLNDKRTLKKINSLIKDIERSPYTGLGKPEALKYEFSGWWSRRIDDKNRIVYRINENSIEIAQCKTHYKE